MHIGCHNDLDCTLFGALFLTLLTTSCCFPAGPLRCAFLLLLRLQSPRIMGEFTISTVMTIVVWMSSLGVIGINLFIVGGFLVDEGDSTPGGGWWLYTCAGVGGLLYLGFILFLMWQDLVRWGRRAASLFVKLGGHDVVHDYAAAANSPDDTDSDLGGSLQRASLQDDDGRELLAAGLRGRSSSGPGPDYAPVSTGWSLARRAEDRENGGRAEKDAGGGQTSPVLSSPGDAHRSGEEGGDSRA